jgi:hypothetical protein
MSKECENSFAVSGFYTPSLSIWYTTWQSLLLLLFLRNVKATGHERRKYMAMNTVSVCNGSDIRMRSGMGEETRHFRPTVFHRIQNHNTPPIRHCGSDLKKENRWGPGTEKCREMPIYSNIIYCNILVIMSNFEVAVPSNHRRKNYVHYNDRNRDFLDPRRIRDDFRIGK